MEVIKKSVSQFSQPVSAVAVLKGICSHLKSDLQIIYLMSLISKTSFCCRLLPSCSRIVKYEL